MTPTSPQCAVPIPRDRIGIQTHTGGVVGFDTPIEAALVRAEDAVVRLPASARDGSIRLLFPLTGVQALCDGDSWELLDPNRVAIASCGEVALRRLCSAGVTNLLMVAATHVGQSRTENGLQATSPRSVLFTSSGQLTAHRLAAGFRRLDRYALAELVREAFAVLASHPAIDGGSVRLVEAAKELIALAPAPLSLSRIASALRVTPTYLTDLFRRTEGLPLQKYQVRLRLARSLGLLSSGMDLAELALELGFSSHSHFTCAFRSNFGITPSAFRESLAGSEPVDGQAASRWLAAA